MPSRLRSRRTFAYFGSRENLGTESYKLSVSKYTLIAQSICTIQLTLAINLNTLLSA